MTTPGPPIPCPLAEPPGCCPVGCCDPTTYAGKTLSFNYTNHYGLGGGGSGWVEAVTATHVGGNNFLIIAATRTLFNFPNPTACADFPHNNPFPDTPPAGIITINCRTDLPAPYNPWYYLTGAVTTPSSPYSSSDGCNPDNSLRVTYTAVQSTDCNNISVDYSICQQYHMLENCTGGLIFSSFIHDVWTASIA